ncbi:hypothetical protein [Micromonospora sp. WMMD812]|uniref:hypothetical protein n=1 Tax=Micromonospora sp. WMMD812 TaxID=3015152 RepID=UPI00248B9B93|nr:hypothetical protein [Micromonospora sp. WMMD812]WBB71185.1 hypothetical protein O7603_32685 [Micromonospora sp. WMMD812]
MRQVVTGAGDRGTYRLADADLIAGAVAVAARLGDRDRLPGDLTKTTTHPARPDAPRPIRTVSKLGSPGPPGNRLAIPVGVILPLEAKPG